VNVTDKSTVILIEDEEEFAKRFRSKLMTWDATYNTVTNTAFGPVKDERLNDFVSEVLDVVAQHRDDCAALFLDLGLGLPDEDDPMQKGLHVGKALRNEFYEIPILILTRFGKKDHVTEAYLYDFDAYIEKGDFATWRSDQFHGRVLRAMRKRQAMVRNLPRYYSQHIERFPDSPKVDPVIREETVRVAKPDTAGQTSDTPAVVVFSALDEELGYLREEGMWSNLKHDKPGVSYRTSDSLCDGIQVVAASAPEMGLTHAAATATAMFMHWRPQMAFIIGVCAGRKEKKVQLGDVVVPKLAYNFQFGSFENGEVQKQLAVAHANEQFHAQARDYFGVPRNVSAIGDEFPPGGRRPHDRLNMHFDPMACSDLVVMDKDKFKEAADADRKVIAIDMESYAFLLAARLAHVEKALVIKSVTDFADAKKNDDYREYAKFTSTKALLGLLRHLLDVS